MGHTFSGFDKLISPILDDGHQIFAVRPFAVGLFWQHQTFSPAEYHIDILIDGLLHDILLQIPGCGMGYECSRRRVGNPGSGNHTGNFLQQFGAFQHGRHGLVLNVCIRRRHTGQCLVMGPHADEFVAGSKTGGHGRCSGRRVGHYGIGDICSNTAHMDGIQRQGISFIPSGECVLLT